MKKYGKKEASMMMIHGHYQHTKRLTGSTMTSSVVVMMKGYSSKQALHDRLYFDLPVRCVSAGAYIHMCLQ